MNNEKTLQCKQKDSETDENIGKGWMNKCEVGTGLIAYIMK
jgi:hypothetical protein